MSQPASNPDDHDASVVVDSLSVLLRQLVAETGHPLAVEASNRYDGLYDYLSTGNNPLPAPWRRSVPWTSGDPQVLDAEVEATLASVGSDVEVGLIVEDEDGQAGWDFHALDNATPETTPEATSETTSETTAPAALSALSPLTRRNPFQVTAPNVPDELRHPLPPVDLSPPTVPPVPAVLPAPTPTTPPPIYGPFHGGMPLSEVRAKVQAERLTGLNCPACGQFYKIYNRSVTSTIAKHLIEMYNQTDRFNNGWFHAKNDLGDSGDLSKARHFGIIEQEADVKEKGRSGFWRLTSTGIGFVVGMYTLPKYALVCKGETKQYEGKQITIENALRNKFNYATLMNLTPGQSAAPPGGPQEAPLPPVPGLP